MEIFQQILFGIALVTAVYFFSKRMSLIRKLILLGKEEDLHDQSFQRWKNVFLLALGQKKMFKNPTVAFLHLLVYVGFIIINIEMIEIMIDGLFGTHRFLLGLIPSLYSFLINSFELLAALVIVACVIFLVRRNLIHVKRLWSNDLRGWPSKDANIILVVEIVLMMLFLKMNAADTLLQSRGVGDYSNHATGNFYISSLLHPLMNRFSIETLVLTERICWWLHIFGVLGFLNYLSWSKHLHIILAFPNAYFSRLEPQGKLKNMPAVQKEVLYAFQPEMATAGTNDQNPSSFGAKDIQDLSWKNLLDAFSCTECGRCTAACPANQTGKMLSPRKIMMDTRDRAEEIGSKINQGIDWKAENRTLLYDYISEEEIRACTTCNACVEACPVSINPLDIIVELRRYLIMEKSSSPQEWTSMFGNIENNFAPWKFSPDQRINWTKEST
ncbi:MAG: (Fe-S)-binding protein [Bacteroidetes bacterium]|nr:(Fe-S)-binding protein [Bacteroidota bacterium]